MSASNPAVETDGAANKKGAAPTPPKPSLGRSSLGFAAATSVSRLSGLARDLAIAVQFGAGGLTDLFFIAFRLPNMLRQLFAEGAFSRVFVPVLSEYSVNKSPEELRDFASRALGSLSFWALVAAVIGYLLAPALVLAFAPGLAGQDEPFALASELARITFPYIALVAWLGFAGSLLNAHQHFLAPASAPIVLNCTLIAAALWGGAVFAQPILALAWGVIIGGILQLLLQLPFLAHKRLLVPPRRPRGHEGVAKVMRLMGPSALGGSTYQLAIWIDTALASFLAAGSITWLHYGQRMIGVPLGIVGVAIATVALPRLALQHSRGGNASASLSEGLRLGLFFSLPAALALMLLAPAVMTTLFEHGRFDGEDSRMAALALQAYCLGLPALIANKLFVSAFFARQDPKTAVRVTLTATAANLAYSLGFIALLIAADWGALHTALAVASSLAAWQQTLAFAVRLRRQKQLTHLRRQLAPCLAILIASLAMAAALGALASFWPVDAGQSVGQRVLALSLSILGGAVVYFASYVPARAIARLLWRQRINS